MAGTNNPPKKHLTNLICSDVNTVFDNPETQKALEEQELIWVRV
jgi:hypothetical protein